MTAQIVPARRALTGRAVRRIIGRCALAAVGAGLLAISVSAFGADLETGYTSAIAVPSQLAPPGRYRLSRLTLPLPSRIARWSAPGLSTSSMRS